MRVPRRIVVAFGACGLTAAALAAAGPGVDLSGSAAAGPAATGSAGQALSGGTVQPGGVHCGPVQSSPPTPPDCEKAYKVACYEPAQIRQAYNLPAVYASGVTGRGATIVIVDSYGSPTIKHDLGTFDQAFGLPAGKVPAYNPDNSDMVGWASETTLDVEYAHTVAPGANLLLVETPVSET